MRFADGAEYDVVHWYQLVQYTAEWLFRCRYLSDGDLPIQSKDKKRFIISATNPGGRGFRKPHKLNVGWKFDKYNANRGGHLCDAKELLRYCRIDPCDVLVRVVP